MMLLLSSCATRQDLADLQRQLQTTRGELAAVRKQAVETKTLVEGDIGASENERKELLSRVREQMGAILSTIEAQQRAIASLNSFAQERVSAADARSEERLKKLEDRINQQEKRYLSSQGNLGSRLEELGAEVKIIQGKLEENNNLLAEQGARFDELNQQTARSGGRVETTEANLRGMKEAQASQAEKLNRVEGQVASLVKNWESWREQANRSLAQMGELEKRLGSMEQELRRLKEAYRSQGTTPPEAGNKEIRIGGSTESGPRTEGKEVTASKEPATSAPPPGGKEIYDRAKADYDREDYELAIWGFRDYLTKYPKGSYAVNSQYWVGECYYSQKKFKEAIAEFHAVLENYPKSEKAADALLKKAFCYHELKGLDTEKAILNEVLEKYPKTEAARIAKSRLGNLK